MGWPRKTHRDTDSSWPPGKPFSSPERPDPLAVLPLSQQSDGLVLHVIAPFYEDVDWDDLESIDHHRSMTAFNRTKTCNRVIAGELARRYAGKISSVAFDPTFFLDND